MTEGGERMMRGELFYLCLGMYVHQTRNFDRKLTEMMMKSGMS